jgi:hypothetical protein
LWYNGFIATEAICSPPLEKFPFKGKWSFLWEMDVKIDEAMGNFLAVPSF